MSELTNCLQGLIAHYHMTGPHELIVCDAADRIRELEARNEYLLSELRAVGELPGKWRWEVELMCTEIGNTVRHAVETRANELEALLK